MAIINAFPSGISAITANHSNTSITGILKGDGSKIQVAMPGVDYQMPLSLASENSNGLLSAQLFSKLSGVEENANNYTLPKATALSLGGVMVGKNLAINNGLLFVNDASSTTAGVVNLTTQYFKGSKTFTNSVKITDKTAASSSTTGALTVSGGIGVAGNIYCNAVYGAIYNDYAEYRESNEVLLPGMCVYENGDDTISKSTRRMLPGAMIVSDTYGFCIGCPDCSYPVAVSGRVLAYPYEPLEVYMNNIGSPVCSGPDGTVSIMSDIEAREYPWLIIGIVSAVPNYTVWGSNNIPVDGRVWIKIK